MYTSKIIISVCITSVPMVKTVLCQHPELDFLIDMLTISKNKKRINHAVMKKSQCVSGVSVNYIFLKKIEIS